MDHTDPYRDADPLRDIEDLLQRPSAPSTIAERMATVETSVRYLAREMRLLEIRITEKMTQASLGGLSDAQVRKVLRMIEVFEEETTESKQFNNSIRISVITMIISVLIFSVVVPIVQHYLLK